MLRPTSVEPVKEMKEGTGCSTKASPISEPAPTKTLSKPAGSPASSKMRANSKPPVIGVSLAGLTTTALPRIGRINALFTQVQQLWTAVDSFDTPAMQPNPADGEPATLRSE